MQIFRKKNAEKEKITMKHKANRKRTERLSLCLTAEEKGFITDAANEAGISRTDLIMKAVREEPITVIDGLPEITVELNRQGNNLNQLAKKANTLGYAGLLEIRKTTEACRNTYMVLMRFVDTWNVRLRKQGGKPDDCENECNQEQ